VDIYFILLLFLVPFYLMVINSFKTTQQFIISPFSLPSSLNFQNYLNAFERMNYLRAFLNSLIVTLTSVTLVLITSSMTAYFLVRHNWKLTKILFAGFVASMIVPFQAVMIPLVTVYGRMQMLNNKPILIFMYVGFGQAFAVFILHGFLKNVPLEMEEAAQIDGCNKLQVFFRVVLPLLKPVLVTLLILDVLWIWNDFLLPNLILLAPAERTLPLSTYSFFNSYSVDFAPLMAGIVITILPVLIVYMFSQKQIVAGIVQGAIK